MSQVNFVEQFNLIMQYAQRNKLTSYERLFFLALFHCANSLARTAENYEWPDDYFPVSNTELTGWTGFDERAIRNARNSLKEKGLLDFEKGDGKKRDPAYRIFYLRRTGYKIVPDTAGGTYTGCENAGDCGNTGCENAGGGDCTGCENAGDREKTGYKFAGDDSATGCENAGEQPAAEETGNKFAPDTVGDHFIISKRKDTNVNVNIPPTPAPAQEAPADPLVNPEFGRVMGYFLDNINPMPSGLAVEGLKHFTESLCADVVIHAMQICQDEKHTNWQYLRKILLRYEREGVRTMLDVQRDEEQRDAARSFKRPQRQQEAAAGGFVGLVDLDAAVEPMGGLVAGYGRRW